jgi:hypothetical protein
MKSKPSDVLLGLREPIHALKSYSVIRVFVTLQKLTLPSSKAILPDYTTLYDWQLVPTTDKHVSTFKTVYFKNLGISTTILCDFAEWV